MNVRLYSHLLAVALCCIDFVSAHDGDHERTRSSTKSLARNNEVQIIEEDGKRVVTSNGIPNHTTGRFPNRNNPNTISEQSYRFEMPLNPKQNPQPTVSRGIFGVAVNGVVFEPGTAERWNNRPDWAYEALTSDLNLGLDQSHAHVQPTGAYHYHALPNGLIKTQGAADKLKNNEMLLIGWAADGFPMYAKYAHRDSKGVDSELVEMKSSYQLKQGSSRPSKPDGPGGDSDGSFASDYEFVEGSGDLDACNGREGVTGEFPEGTYYYVLTEDFPFIPRYYKGSPDPSFNKGRGPDRAGGPGQRSESGHPRRGGGPPPHHDRRPPHGHGPERR